jgi:erythromycin esterase
MAENVRWVLAREGPAGRVLVFAHNAHVKNAPTEGGVWRAFARPPRAMGQYLRAALGRDVVLVGASGGAGDERSGTAADAGGVDEALELVAGRTGARAFVLDLRTAGGNPGAAAWLAGRRSLRANGGTFLTLSPGVAFDALVFVGALTPARSTSPQPTR